MGWARSNGGCSYITKYAFPHAPFGAIVISDNEKEMYSLDDIGIVGANNILSSIDRDTLLVSINLFFESCEAPTLVF